MKTDMEVKSIRPYCPFENYADINACTFGSMQHLSRAKADGQATIIASNTKFLKSDQNSKKQYDSSTMLETNAGGAGEFAIIQQSRFGSISHYEEPVIV